MWEEVTACSGRAWEARGGDDGHLSIHINAFRQGTIESLGNTIIARDR